MRRTGSFLTVLLAFALVAISQYAGAAEYPTKPVRIVVGFPAAGISDGLARALAKNLGPALGQQVIVDNRPGAGTTIASDLVAKSAPDGHTLFMQDMTTHAVNASLYRSLPYDPIKDFTPVTLVASTALVLVVHPSLPVKNVKDLVTLAKGRPGEVSYGSSGNGTIIHLAGETFKTRAGVNMVHVPYKSGTLAVLAILGGEIATTFATTPTAVQQVSAGKLRALGVTTRKRAAALPDIPTMEEAGLPGFEIVLYNGILAPAGLPKDVLTRLNSEIIKALGAPDVKAFYSAVSADLITSTPEEFGAHMSSEIAKLGKAVKDSGARAD
jgi:tripartite-type tricarboxylate transporter receptor subunit TctC